MAAWFGVFLGISVLSLAEILFWAFKAFIGLQPLQLLKLCTNPEI